ncbi:STAS domain-containing protein [Bailinhaonella thermotolerans]|uniref:Anti-sigma factor antagonist n=1 Tax=Bailinhaonella thermotolerans TaxID=1070861 RepID=A0A3A4A115_9ACTN|nr:STAS domain-containing protein [Bailinhaonella thermotolerans]RJL22089.1 anti-sigma factor antagonist [Bailinhaonella thermotolerans]
MESDTTLDMAVGRDGGHIVVAISGELHMGNAGLLGRLLTELVEQGCRELVVDARGLAGCDGAGWQVLLAIRWRLAGDAGMLRVTGLSPRLLRVCRMMELTEVFGLEPALERALAARSSHLPPMPVRHLPGELRPDDTPAVPRRRRPPESAPAPRFD